MQTAAAAPWRRARKRAERLFSVASDRAGVRGSAEPEPADHLRELLGLLQHRACRRRRFLGHRGVLLGRLIHLVDRGVDLVQRRGLFLGAGGDIVDDRLISDTLPTILASNLPVSATSLTPLSTSVLEAEIRPLISLAAPAERCASARTSEATTAKPRPASPARAASTPAFKARRLVWNAISSITPMIWPIWPTTSRSRPSPRPRWRTTSPLFLASPRASDTTMRACLAPSVVFLTVAVISSSAAAVSSRLAACCSVRRDRSSEAVGSPGRPRRPCRCSRQSLYRGFEIFVRDIEIVAELLVSGEEFLFDRLFDVVGGQTGQSRSEFGEVGNVGRELDDLHYFSVEVENRIVGGLDPDFLAVLAKTFERIDDVFALFSFPRIPDNLASGLARLDEHAMRLALDLIESIAEQLRGTIR